MRFQSDMKNSIKLILLLIVTITLGACAHHECEHMQGSHSTTHTGYSK